MPSARSKKGEPSDRNPALAATRPLPPHAESGKCPPQTLSGALRQQHSANSNIESLTVILLDSARTSNQMDTAGPKPGGYIRPLPREPARGIRGNEVDSVALGEALAVQAIMTRNTNQQQPQVL